MALAVAFTDSIIPCAGPCFQRVVSLFSLCYLLLEKSSKSLIPLGDCPFVLNCLPVFLENLPVSGGKQRVAAVEGREHLVDSPSEPNADPQCQCGFDRAVVEEPRSPAGFDGSMTLMEFAAAAWVAAFGGFVLLYGPVLFRQPPVWAGRE